MTRQRQPPDWTRLLWVLVLATALAAYANSLRGAFIFDDHARIIEDLNLRRLSTCLLNSSRPLAALTFHANYAAGGFNPADYHAVNLAIHATAGLALLGLLRLTLKSPVLAASCGAAAPWLAAFAAAVWVAHPLQTEGVTYIVQRAEALMGLCYLLTLYCFARSVWSGRGHRWQTAAVVACALGMASKPVMITAPLMVLLYDRTFCAASAREALRARRPFYAALAGTWIIPAALLSVPHESASTAGFGTHVVTPLAYLRTQPEVLVHYLRLSVWPYPLCLDYAWPVASGWQQTLLPACVIGGLLVLTVRAVWRRQPLGFAGAWFFGILAPTSSVVPVADLAVEHRLYLPIAAPITAAVVASAVLWMRALRTWPARGRRGLGAGLAIGVVLVLIAMTRARNRVYASERAMWADVAARRPANLRAQSSLIGTLLEAERFVEAEALARRVMDRIRDVAEGRSAYRISPSLAAYCYPRVQDQLGRALLGQERYDEACVEFAGAIQASPSNAVPYLNLGLALSRNGKPEKALQVLRVAVTLEPAFGRAYAVMGSICAKEGRCEEAVSHYWRAVRADPDFLPVKSSLAWLLAACPEDRLRDGPAAVQLAEAVCAATGYRSIRGLDVLAAAYAECGRYAEAAAAARRAWELMLKRGEGVAAEEGEALSGGGEGGGMGVAIDSASLEGRLRLYEEGRPFRLWEAGK